MDVSSFGEQIEQVYESATIGVNAFQVLFSLIVVSCQDTLYSINCRDCSQLFGCVGLRRAKNVILNRSYSRHEYEQLAVKLVSHMRETGEWGEFFPSSISAFAYNESMAQICDPLDQASAKALGYKWKNKEPQDYKAQSYTLAERISETGDEVVSQLLACENCNKNYKLIAQELGFYRRNGLPPPRCCPDCRHLSRMQSRNPLNLFDRNCQNCNCELQSSYSVARPEIVYCEKCYQESLV